jgi:hypothetical protein
MPDISSLASGSLECVPSSVSRSQTSFCDFRQRGDSIAGLARMGAALMRTSAAIARGRRA